MIRVSVLRGASVRRTSPVTITRSGADGAATISSLRARRLRVRGRFDPQRVGPEPAEKVTAS